MKQLIQLSLVLIFCTNCATTTSVSSIYLSPIFKYYQASDKVVAILPFDVVNYRIKLPKKENIDNLEQMQEVNAYVMQRDLYRYCLRVLSKDRYTIDFQHVNETNKILEEAGIDYKQIKQIGKRKLAKILGVDAVISGEVHQRRNRYLLFNGGFFRNNKNLEKVNARIAIHNKEQKKAIWKYKDGVSRSDEDTMLSLSRKLLRTVAEHIPYQKGITYEKR